MKNDAPVDFGPKPNLTDKQVIEAFIRGGGLDHERILREEAQSDGSGEPHRIKTSEREQWELRTLTKAFAQSVFTKPNGIPPVSSARFGSPGEIRTPVDGFLPGFRGPKPIIGRVICFRPLLVHYTTGLQETRVSGQVPISLLRQSNQHFQI